MYIRGFILLALSALSTALPTTILEERDACVSNHTYFELAQPTIFFPSGGGTWLGFTFVDSDNDITSACSYRGNFTAGTFYPCYLPDVHFSFDGAYVINILESYIDCATNRTAIIEGTVNINYYCYESLYGPAGSTCVFPGEGSAYGGSWD